jgi:hypothetical protein
MTGCAGDGIIDRKIFIIEKYPSQRSTPVGNSIISRCIDLAEDIRGIQVSW